ncbi:hypothetical protein MMC24_003351 [Lignoscripta atroalba]|nr:hypothetical protein [Lignoscripta atroalba]
MEQYLREVDHHKAFLCGQNIPDRGQANVQLSQNFDETIDATNRRTFRPACIDVGIGEYALMVEEHVLA